MYRATAETLRQSHIIIPSLLTSAIFYFLKLSLILSNYIRFDNSVTPLSALVDHSKAELERPVEDWLVGQRETQTGWW